MGNRWRTTAGSLTAMAVVLAAFPGSTAGSGSAVTGPSTAKAPVAAKKVAAPTRLPGYNTERNAYFGDLHVHTKLSFDAYIFNVRASPDDAYRFAKGETLGHSSGFNIRLSGGPLDFVAVTDHWTPTE